MRAEERKLDRQITSEGCAPGCHRDGPPPWLTPLPPTPEIKNEETKVKQSIKQAAKRGDMSTAKLLAKEIVRSRKAVARLHTSKAQMNSVVMQMQNQMAQQKVMGHMVKSTEVMGAMNRLVKVGDIRQTMQAMQKEMCKAGLIEEMVDDSMEALDEDADEDAADEEVAKVMEELNADTFANSSSAPTREVQQQEAAAEAPGEDDAEEEQMRARLQELRG